MANRYWVGGTATWDATAGTKWASTSGAAGGQTVPTSADAVYFDAASGANVITLGSGYNPSVSALSMSGFTGTLAFGSQNISLNATSGTIYTGNTNMTVTGTPVINCVAGGAGTRTIASGTAASLLQANAISFNVTSGSDILTLTSNHAVKNLNFTGFTGTFSVGNRTIYGNLTISSGMTVSAGANTTTFAATSGTQQITTNGVTLDFPLTFNGIGGTFAFQDALTQGSTRAFTITNGTVQLKNGVTSTVGSFVTSGTNQKFLQSTTPGSQATLSQASGTVNASYLTIKDINATGGATWNALWSNNNVDLGNNTGWFFGDQPIINAVEYTYKIRSFTQPRRF